MEGMVRQREISDDELVLVPHVIEAVDSASLANQVALFRIAYELPIQPVTYLIHPNGGFIAIIETYRKANKVLKGEING